MDKKEAIKILKDFHDKSALFSVRTALETLHPELKESEDEKMMHQLYSWMKEFGGAEEYTEKVHTWLKSLIEKQGTSYTKRDVDDAYVEGMVFAKNELEKQGEKKPIDKIQLGKKYKCIASPRYSTFRRGNIYKPVDNFLCNLMNLCYECFEPIEDSEQKPTDEDMVEALRTEYEKGRADAIAEMEKPTWSVEDMSKVQRICKYLDEAKKYYADITEVRECIDWLKSLKDRVIPQSKQEWSKEDKERFISCLKRLGSGNPEQPETINSKWFKEHVYPQPTWKPSDEEMRALEYIINNAHNTSYSCKIAKELLEQLRRLKGE